MSRPELEDATNNEIIAELLDRLPGLEELDVANGVLLEKIEVLEEANQELRDDLRQAETERDEAQEAIEKLEGDHPLREPDLMEIMRVAHQANQRATEYFLRRLGWHEVASLLASEGMTKRATDGR